MKKIPEQVAIVTTTIYVPKLLKSYAEDAKKHGHNPLFVVIADKKTPPEAEKFCDALKKKGGDVEYFSVARQEKYLSRFPALKKHLPWNSIQRRNVGILFAYEHECPKIITIDDDNFRLTSDYIGTHALGPQTLAVVSSSTGWVNVCRLLEEKHGRDFYHRGFPLEMRHDHETWEERKRNAHVVVNAGLWLEDPDVDAMTRLHHHTKPIEATRHSGKNIAVEKGHWTPFNSQNTALAREVIPAYFLSPMVGRYDDIWAAYIVKRIADHLGHHIAFGKPIVRQARNPHNYWRDLDKERYGHALTMRFVEALAATPLMGRGYARCYDELAKKLPRKFEKMNIADDERRFLDGYFEGMRIWRDTFASL